MKMSDVFKVDRDIDIDDCDLFNLDEMGAAAHAINQHDALVAMNAELIKMSSSISQMCVGELTMGCRLDPQTIGEYIYSVTSMNSEELTAKAKELSHER